MNLQTFQFIKYKYQYYFSWVILADAGDTLKCVLGDLLNKKN